MTSSHRWWRPLAKEARALLPTFAAAAAAVSIGGLLEARIAALVLAVYCWSVVALGAHAIGHEYAHRTLTLLLGQPRTRNRILAEKAVVLVPMVVALTLLTALSLPGSGLAPLLQAGLPQTALVVAMLCALSLAPLLSMVGRGTLPATVFTIAIPGMLLVLGEFLGTVRYGFRSPDLVWGFKLAFVQSSLTYLCPAAALAAWWQFQRLQAIEGSQDVRLPDWLRKRESGTRDDARVRVQHPAWLLFRKELHLQQITYVVVGMYVVAWLALWLLQHRAPDVPRLPLQPLTLLYLGVLALLTGSLASAEERQLGTLPSQQLLPVAAWKQWAIKAGTAIGLTVLLGVGLPLLLYAVIPPPDDQLPGRLTRELLMGVVLVSTVSLYVSSLSGSGVRAMMASIPVLIGSFVYGVSVAGLVANFGSSTIRLATASESRAVQASQLMGFQSTTYYAAMVTVILTVLVLLRFGFLNHRTSERRLTRLAAQAAVLFTVVTAGLATPFLLW